MEKLIDIIREDRGSYWGERLRGQLQFGAMLSQRAGGAYDDILRQAEALVSDACGHSNPPTQQVVLAAEALLEPLREKAKAYRVICAAHAHIDMNWQWGWDETVGVAIDTVSTMLQLLEEYPDFKFSLSQASTYKILYDYAPGLFARIKEQVHLGRWEVTAPSWVECDKNMPSGESLSRQILYAKEFLSKTLEIDPDSINVDFEPDTFGHSVNVPEILSHAGVKYYYHCRGTNMPHSLYRWVSPAGNEILVNRELNFYSTEINTKMGPVAIETADKTGIMTSLRVYGVGDHGGGPSRRDIERLHDMAAWPCFPNFVLGTYGEFFAQMEQHRHKLPVVKGEINFIFDGCFSSQSKIKAGNRKLENLLYSCEAISSAAARHGAVYEGEAYKKAWRNVALCHFHDIVTGSGVEATRHHALGLYQESAALAESARKLAIAQISARISTQELLPLPAVNVHAAVPGPYAEGAGVGSGQASVGLGKRRVFHIWNPLAFKSTQVTEIMLWDWNYDPERLIFTDHIGTRLACQPVDKGFHRYWGHDYLKVLVEVSLPALGYATLVCDEGPAPSGANYWPEKKQQWREQFVLENDCLRVEIDSLTGAIATVQDKESGKELGRGGQFRYILEGNRKELSNWDKEMSSWLVGRYKTVEPLGLGAEMSLSRGPLRDSVTAEISVKNSKIICEFSLDKGSRVLRCKSRIDWLETGSLEKGVPQLAFCLPIPFDTKEYLFDVPFGVIRRSESGYDMPGCSFAAAEKDGSMVALLGNNQYGYRCDQNAISATLIRSSFDPDPFPECGAHEKAFCLYFGNTLADTQLLRLSQSLNVQPTVVTNARHGGDLPATDSFLSLEGEVVVSSVKETPHGRLIRFYEAEGNSPRVTLSGVQEAWRSDINENLLEKLEVTAGKLSLTAPAHGLYTLIVK